jgi:hypothetical protein
MLSVVVMDVAGGGSELPQPGLRIPKVPRVSPIGVVRGYRGCLLGTVEGL